MTNLNGTIWQFNDEINVDRSFTVYKIGYTRPVIQIVSTEDNWYGISMDNQYSNSFGYKLDNGGTTSFYTEINGWSDDAYKTIKFIYEPDTFTSTTKANFIAWLQENATELPSSYYITNNISLNGIANAIREKIKSEESLAYPADFINNIRNYTSDATAAAEDIFPGKTAYINGDKITGTMPFASGVSF